MVRPDGLIPIRRSSVHAGVAVVVFMTPAIVAGISFRALE